MQALAKPVWPILQPAHPLARGLVAAYPLFEGSGGTLHDFSGQRSDLSVNGTPAWGGSAFGAAPSFGGSTYFETASAQPNLPVAASAAWAFGGWINASAYVSLTGIFGFGFQMPESGHNGQQRALLEFNNHYYFWGDNADWDTGVAFDADGNFHQIVFTTSGGSSTPTVQFYRDGKLAASGSPGAALVTAGSFIAIGAGHTSEASFFKGVVSDFFVANRQWSAADVAQHYYDPFAMYRRPSRWWETVTAGGGGFTAKFRKTFSGIGGRIGSRQPIAWSG